MDTALRTIITAVLVGIIGSQIGLTHNAGADAGVSPQSIDATETAAGFVRRPVEAPAPIEPRVFEAATAEQVELFTSAVAAFEAAGLELPPLVVVFDLDGEGCKGHPGLFTSGTPARIELCTEMRHVVLHELAHAWEWHNLDDAVRGDFVEDHGLATWNSRDHEWADRGVEVFADTVAIGMVLVDGSDNPKVIERLCSFEEITGVDHQALTEADCDHG